MKYTRILSAVLAATGLLLTGAAAEAATISVNFTESTDHTNQQIATSTAAGVSGHHIANWNNVHTAASAVPDLNDDSGSATTADVSWAAVAVWGDGSANGDADLGIGDAQLQRGYLDENPTGYSIDVTEIPYDSYSLILYYSSDQGDDGTHGGVDVNTIPTGPAGSTANWGANPSLTAGVNVQIVNGLTGPSLRIDGPARDGSVRHSISGFQIVNIPEPASMALFGLGAVMLGIMARRRG